VIKDSNKLKMYTKMYNQKYEGTDILQDFKKLHKEKVKKSKKSNGLEK
jgi:hypothetical protein